MDWFEFEPDDEVPEVRSCDHPGCAADGEFRAPRSRNGTYSYYWFCLEHVREYNASWNYFAGMSRDEIERFQREDLTWHRPTWRLGGGLMGVSALSSEVDEWDLFGGSRWDRGLGGAAAPPARTPTGPEKQALQALDLGVFATLADIKTRYKDLVKRFHPDRNGGSKAAEERLKVINQAYAFLRTRRYS